MKTSTHSTEEVTLLKAFKYFDLNNSGHCELDEFLKAIAKIGITGFEDEDFTTIFHYYDRDQSGSLDYKEFVGQLYSNQSIARKLPNKANPNANANEPRFSEEEAEEVLLKIRARLASRGVRGISTIARNFKIIDDNNSQTIDFEEFKKAIKDFRFGLNEHELQVAFAAFDDSNSGDINYDEFLFGIRGKMNQFRCNLVAQAFNILDKDGSGRIELDDIKQSYNARKHPDVINGKRTEDEVLLEFLETFESHHHYLEGVTPDHIVTLEEFIDYYENVSMSIDDDAYFEVMMNNAWRMNSNTTFNNEKRGWKGEEQEKGNKRDDGGVMRKRRLGRNEPEVEGRANANANLRSNKPRNQDQLRSQPKPQSQLQEGNQIENDLITKLRLAIANRGGKGIIGLGRLFKIYDDNGSKTLDIKEFTKAMKEYQLGFSNSELNALFKCFDHDGQGTINYEEFLRTVRGEMNEIRKEIVRQAFMKMDIDQSGKIDLNDIKGIYDAKMHPDVITGKKTPEDIYLEFLDTFETHHTLAKGVRDKRVTIEEFIEYYNNISMSIDSDEYFIEMIKRAWKLTKDPVYTKNKAWVSQDDSVPNEQKQQQQQMKPSLKHQRRNSAPYGIDDKPTDYQVSSQFKCKAGISNTNQIRMAQQTQQQQPLQQQCQQQQPQQQPQSVHTKLSSILSKRGTRGIMSLRRSFMICDDNGTRKIGLKELIELFSEYRIEFTPRESQELFDYFDSDNSSFIDYEEFVQGIVGEMTSYRKNLVIQAFNVLDKSKTGRVSYKTIKDSFNAQSHPDVITGKRNESEVLAEFIDNFEYHFTLLNTKGSNERNVHLDEFIEFYSYISMSIDNDGYFERVMTSVWNF